MFLLNLPVFSREQPDTPIRLDTVNEKVRRIEAPAYSAYLHPYPEA